MKSKIEFTLLFLLGFVLGLVLLATDARAQEPAPDKSKAEPPAAASSAQSAPEGAYTITSSIEFGVRGIVIEGNADKYRSDLNYTPGFRIFDSSFMMKSRDNTGPAFDTLMISSFGWGTDPNKYLRVNAEKTKAYRFNANYRRFDYFNNLYNFALGQHTSNTEYRQGDFDLTILPQNDKIRFNLGYSLDRNSGPSVTTYDYQRDEYPILAPTRWAADEYRVGADAKLWVFDLSFIQGWRFFKEDTEYLINMPNIGNSTTNTSVLNSFHRSIPTRGNTPFTRLSLHTLIAKKLDFTGRYIYTSGHTDFGLFETATGVDGSGNKITSDTLSVTGSAKRPNGMGDLAATYYVTDRFRISDTFRVNNFRINGGDVLADALFRTKPTPFGETVLPPLFTNTLSFRTIKYRRYLNTLEGDYDINSRLSVHAGYRYTNRRIELGSSNITVGGAANPESEEVDNSTNTFIFGFKARPVKMWSVYFDLERGSADNVFTRVDNYDFTNVRVRSILRPNRTLSFNASLVTKDNSNPAIREQNLNFGVNIKSRVFTASADYSPNERFSLNGGYTRANVTSDADIILFLNNVATFGQSRYFMRDNFFFFTGYVRMFPRAMLYGGYRLHNDPGQGSRIGTPSLLVGSFPYEMQSPEVKLVFNVHKNVDWIAGYQYFGYEPQSPNTSTQFYHVHLPYTSLRISFGRE
jgi:hypothetical protein